MLHTSVLTNEEIAVLDGKKLSELYYRVLKTGGHPLPQVDLMYLVSQTRSNQASVLDRARECNGKIGIAGHAHTEEKYGYPGCDVWGPELIARGIPASQIVPVHGGLVTNEGREYFHTLSEMQALVQYAKSNNLREVTIVAPRFHLLRAYMSAVHAVASTYPKLRMHPRLGLPQDANEPSSHSQGKLNGKIIDFTFEETNRIYMYEEQGNLPSPEEVLEHMDRCHID